MSEAQEAESKRDFVHKMKIAMKEANEAIFWQRVCFESDHLPFDKYLNEKIKDIIKVLSKIISSTKRKYSM